MIVLGRVMLIPCFTAYLIHYLIIYFYNLKTKCDRKKRTSVLDCIPQKYILKKKKKKTFLCVHKVKYNSFFLLVEFVRD